MLRWSMCMAVRARTKNRRVPMPTPQVQILASAIGAKKKNSQPPRKRWAMTDAWRMRLYSGLPSDSSTHSAMMVAHAAIPVHEMIDRLRRSKQLKRNAVEMP
eukprot:Mycagemm_TRINITY_DN10208_c0_g1::TRINITY_DN10208_c0_g1_i1::g.4075::m.4075 type:complete len:102 gc:universal TRINITY_DN10208_c0_g1_i1:1044-739(-)